MVNAAAPMFTKQEVEQTLPRRFAAQVALHGQRIAVEAEDATLTYRELDALANRLAARIVERTGPQAEPVALCFKPGAMMIAAVMAVLKSGKFSVPLDASAPPARNRQILDDLGSRLLLTDGRCNAPPLPCPTLKCDELGSGDTADDIDLSESPHSLAGVVYTSGSTGRPKGVMLAHRNVLHAMYLHTHSLAITSQDRLSMSSPYHALAGSTAMFRALLNGATLLPFDLKARGVAELAQWIERKGITLFHAVPSVFRALVDGLPAGHRFPQVRLIHLGGEPVLARDVAAWRDHFGEHCVLLNNLGSTEVSTYRQFFITRQTSLDEAIVPVGYAVEDKEVVLLDADAQGVGEIAIRSAYLTPGYWRRPDLTAASLLPVPGAADLRLFRTGDLGRLRPDGCLEHRGRKDHQVKVRGHRVETGDIEAALLEHPGVRQTGVVTSEDGDGQTRLIAYVGSTDRELSSTALRAHVASLLPDYMVPVAFVRLDALPMTPSGKVDRKALPVPDDTAARDTFAPPRTDVERAVAAHFAQLLKLRSVGVDDDFFELGGHSLLAAQLLVRLRREFGVELELRSLFEAPTVGAIASKLPGSLAGSLATAPVARVAGLPIPASLSQSRLWFLQEYDRGSIAYNRAEGYLLRGTLVVDALRHALSAVVARHECLRTTFGAANGEPVQVIHAPTEVALAITNLRALPATERRAEALRCAEAQAARRYDLATGPLLRASLFVLGDDEHVFCIEMHHIVWDGWSTAVFRQDLAAAYASRLRGELQPLPALSFQYADYALWQRRQLRGPALDKQLSYWKRKLADAPVSSELPSDRPRPAQRSGDGATLSRMLDRRLLDDLKTLSRNHRVTLFMALLAAFKVLLARYTRCDDIVVGSPIAGRTRSETEQLIGFFVNSLVYRTDLSGDPAFAELLVRVRDTALSAYAHPDVPFEQLFGELRLQRSQSHSPMFDVLFVLRNMPSVPLALEGLTAERIELGRAAAKFDLSLSAAETDDGLRLDAEYSTDRFDAGTIARLIDHYEVLLGGVVSDAGLRLSALPLLTDQERRTLTGSFAQTHRTAPGTGTVIQRFEEHAHCTPHAVAVEAPAAARGGPARRLTYAELDERVDRLAGDLIARGARGAIVGLCVERSPSMIVALLAILKAKAAYLPLDPGYPSERLAFMLKDSAAPIVVTQASLAARLPAHGVEVVVVDGQPPAGAPPASDRLAAAPDDLAYVIYTSGSTGTPKGVMVEHRALASYAVSAAQEYALVADDRVLQFASINFDASVEEIFACLISGATLVLRDDDMLDSVARFLATCADWKVSVMSLPTAWWHEIAATAPAQRLAVPPSLRLVIVGGEAAVGSRLASWQQWTRGRVALLNTYGPTEATVVTTSWRAAGTVDASQPVPIGRPIAGATIYILDPHLNLVPVGVPGELHIGGAQLARGYLNRPELTDEKFVANPYAAGRLYKTGDLARFLGDGNIEFLGRIDNQVKVRGFRVELGEIESVLGSSPAVQACVVVASDDAAGHKRLVAYVVAHAHAHADAAELRAFLRQRLPDYMLPSALVVLDALPVNANGKLDRKALPAFGYPASAADFVAPSTPTEAKIAAIWADVLGLERVGVHDSFFELGGHSLLATQAVSRMSQALGVHVPLRTLFEAPTVAGQSALLLLDQAATLDDDELARLLDEVQAGS